ncbi:MAG TPA: hypothetical protein VFX30_11310 [bacterium]|nr:hypothetical protein [bacterium]
MDLHLVGGIDRDQFLAKKAALLERKKEFEEKLKKLEAGVAAWLEPTREFLEAAHQAHRVVAEGNLESLKEKAKESGSNFRLAAKTLQFDYRLPWRRLAATRDFFNFGEMWAM